MTKEEIIKNLLATPKIYTHVGMKQAAFSNAIKSIKNGTYKQSSEEAFFAKFGYKLTHEAQYENEVIKKD